MGSGRIAMRILSNSYGKPLDRKVKRSIVRVRYWRVDVLMTEMEGI